MQGRLFTRPFVIASLANMFVSIAWSLSIHFPRFLESIGASALDIGLIFGSAAVASILVKPFVGRFIDRRGRRPMVVSGTLIQVIAVALYFTVAHIDAWAYAVRAMHGISIGISFTALSTYAADVVPAARRTQGLALFGVSGMVSIALGGLIGDLVIEAWEFNGFFWTWLTVAGVALALASVLAEVPQEVHPDPPAGFLASLRQPRLRPLWIISLVFAMAIASYFTFLATFIAEVGFGNVGLFFAAYAGTAIAERVSIGWLPDRVGQKTVLVPAVVAMVLGLLVLSGASSGAAVVVAGALCGGGHGFVFPILYSMTVERSSPADRGSTVAIFTMLFDGGALLAGPAWGLLITWFGYTSMWVSVAVFVLGGLAAFTILDRQHQPMRARTAFSRA